MKKTINSIKKVSNWHEAVGYTYQITFSDTSVIKITDKEIIEKIEKQMRVNDRRWETSMLSRELRSILNTRDKTTLDPEQLVILCRLLLVREVQEAISSGPLTPAESAPINYIKPNPIVKTITTFINKEKLFKDVEVVKILEDGDVYHMDLRFDMPEAATHAQYAREEAKHRAYDIKRQLEILLNKEFNIPSFSIAGVRVVQGVETYCEFSISFIYANKGNIKPTNESIEKDKRVRGLVEGALKPTKQKPEEEDPLKEALGEATEVDLEEEIEKWKILSLQINKYEEDFRNMIKTHLDNKREREASIFSIMEKLNIKTKKVDGIIAKMKDGGFKALGPTPTEKVAILMSKINEATKKVVEAEFKTKTIQNPFAPHKSISFDKGGVQEEGVGDKIKSGFSKFKTLISSWYSGVKELFSAVDELEKLVPVNVQESDGQFPIREGVSSLTVDGKEVDLNSIEIAGVDMNDYPDFCDAYIESMNFMDGTPLTERQIEDFSDYNPEIVSQKAHNTLQESKEQMRESALNFLERMGEIKRSERE